MAGNSNSGRRKGSVSKLKEACLARLAARFPEYDPVLEMAQAAVKLSQAALDAEEFEQQLKSGESDAELVPGWTSSNMLWKDASAAHDRVAQYVTPKLKAADVNMNVEGRVVLDRRVKRLDGTTGDD